MEARLPGRIVKEYLKNHRDTPNHQLARMIYNDNKEVWNNADQIRALIRYYRGQQGSNRRNLVSDKQFFTEPKYENMFNIQSEAKAYEPYILPQNANDILLLSDIHFPYHDIKALQTALKYGQEHKINTIILNGDIIDCYQLSTYEKDPRQRDMSYELSVLQNFFESLREMFPDVFIYYKQGNHEIRYERYVRKKAPELLNIKETQFEFICHFEKYHVNYIKDKRIIKAGKLSILHGDEIRGSGGVNPARWLYLKSKVNSICGHFHRTSEHTEPDLLGSLKGCWSVGSLCNLNPEYDPNPASNKWNHGFAHIKFNKSGFEVDNKRIISGKIV